MATERRDRKRRDDELNEIYANTHVVSLHAENSNLPDTVKNSTILLILNVRDKHTLQRALILLVQSLFSFLFFLWLVVRKHMHK